MVVRKKMSPPTPGPLRGNRVPPTRPGPELTTPDALIERLEDLLTAGNLDAARAELESAGWPGDVTLSAIPDDGTRKMRAATVIGEILFAFGHDVEAQRLLKPYAGENSPILVASLDARR